MVLRSVQEAAKRCPRAVIAAGNFDGVHRGHGAIVEQATDRSRALSAPCMVVTFDPHPQLVIGRKPSLPILTPTSQKLELLSRYEVDAVLVIPFTEAFARTEAESFVKSTYVDVLDIREIIVGYSHNFGRHGRGDRLLLERLSRRYGFAVHVVQPVQAEDSPVNSSHIRAILSAGEIQGAERLLGHPYTITGAVVRGDGRGTALRFPTANLETHDPDVLIPKRGVYAVRVGLGERVLNGVMNIGVRPTFGQEVEHCEVHILDFEGDLYNQSIRVEFVERIRDEKRFETVEALKDQISKDVYTTYNMLKA
jgi:riboflavin kinase/FMN adenylyltransferase